MRVPPRKCSAPVNGTNQTSLAFVDPQRLGFRPNEPRRFSKDDIARACDVLRRFPPGLPLPIVVTEEYGVLVGHLLVHAAQKLGLTAITVIVHAGADPIDQNRYSVAITQLLTKGSWDPADLETWVKQFEQQIEDFSHLDLGFGNGELDRILGFSDRLTAGGAEADAGPQMRAVAVSRPGMVWHLGANRLMVGDATKTEHFAVLMAKLQAAMVITDPPYGCPIDGFVSKKGLHRDFVEAAGEKAPEELKAFFLAFLRNLAGVMRPGALAYLFIDWRSLSLLLDAGEAVFGSLVQLCCWTKDRGGMGGLYRSQHELVLVFRAPGAKHINNVELGRHGRNRTNVWDYPSAASSRSGREGDMLKRHPTPKSVEMIADAILDCTRHGEIVVDCFIGSGTTIIAAERTGRVCLGMELDPLYADVAVRRWQAWTGLAATDDETGRTFDALAAEGEAGEGDRD
jgi:DNA modification methylase